MKNESLKRFWFEARKNHGIGVTAYDLEDARTIVRSCAWAMSYGPDFDRFIENIDITELDQGHVVPNMGIVIDRGIWFPLG